MFIYSYTGYTELLSATNVTINANESWSSSNYDNTFSPNRPSPFTHADLFLDITAEGGEILNIYIVYLRPIGNNFILYDPILIGTYVTPEEGGKPLITDIKLLPLRFRLMIVNISSRSVQFTSISLQGRRFCLRTS